jgi:hypothetical protein
MFVEFGIALLSKLKRIIEGFLLEWNVVKLVFSRRSVEGLELVMHNLQRLGTGFANLAVDGATLKAILGFLALFSHSFDDVAYSEIIAFRSADASEEFSTVDLGEKYCGTVLQRISLRSICSAVRIHALQMLCKICMTFLK